MSKPTPDHARSCEGRSYTCTCGYDAQRDEALQALEEENERLRETVKDRERKIENRIVQIGELYARLEEAAKVAERFETEYANERDKHVHGTPDHWMNNSGSYAAMDIAAAIRRLKEGR